MASPPTKLLAMASLGFSALERTSVDVRSPDRRRSGVDFSLVVPLGQEQRQCVLHASHRDDSLAKRVKALVAAQR